MGTNRTQPFGYRMEYGKVVADPEEARWVVYIYKQYLLGQSLKSLSDALCGMAIRYDAGKQWNKNMIARILQDKRYTGDGQYPRIIDTEIFQSALDKRSGKIATTQISKAQKVLRRKSGQRITPHIEHEVLYLLNTLAGKPEMIIIPPAASKANTELDTLQSELQTMMERLPVDEEQAREKLMELTVAMYEAIDPREYETRRLQDIFEREQPRTELDADLIEATISAVTIDSLGKVKIKLKNDQIIERRECSE